MGGGPPLSSDPFCSGGPPDCPIAAPDAQANHSSPASENHRAVLPWRILIGLDNVFTPSPRARDDLSAAVLRGNQLCQ